MTRGDHGASVDSVWNKCPPGLDKTDTMRLESVIRRVEGDKYPHVHRDSPRCSRWWGIFISGLRPRHSCDATRSGLVWSRPELWGKWGRVSPRPEPRTTGASLEDTVIKCNIAEMKGKKESTFNHYIHSGGLRKPPWTSWQVNGDCGGPLSLSLTKTDIFQPQTCRHRNQEARRQFPDCFYQFRQSFPMMLIINSRAEKTQNFTQVLTNLSVSWPFASENTSYLISLRKMLNLLNFKLFRIVYFP